MKDAEPGDKDIAMEYCDVEDLMGKVWRLGKMVLKWEVWRVKI